MNTEVKNPFFPSFKEAFLELKSKMAKNIVHNFSSSLAIETEWN